MVGTVFNWFSTDVTLALTPFIASRIWLLSAILLVAGSSGWEVKELFLFLLVGCSTGEAPALVLTLSAAFFELLVNGLIGGVLGVAIEGRGTGQRREAFEVTYTDLFVCFCSGNLFQLFRRGVIVVTQAIRLPATERQTVKTA